MQFWNSDKHVKQNCEGNDVEEYVDTKITGIANDGQSLSSLAAFTAISVFVGTLIIKTTTTLS